MNRCKTAKLDTKETWKDVQIYFISRGGLLQRMREDGKLKGKKRRATIRNAKRSGKSFK